jgi:hypothetical protein
MRIGEWYKRYKGLSPIESFNYHIMIFSGLLTLMAALQYKAYIETERAFLVMDEVKLVHKEPSVEEGGLDFIVRIKNVGKHPGTVKKLVIIGSTGKGKFPVTPNYGGGI